MALIGGFFLKNNSVQTEEIRSKIESFSTIAQDDQRAYSTLLFTGRFGHIMSRFKQKPVQVRYASNDMVHLVTLGFHDVVYSPLQNKQKQVILQSSLTAEAVADEITHSEGEFISLLLDRLTGDIHIINDRFGARPFYILSSPKGFWFSSNVMFLIHLTGQKQTIDPLGLLQIFNYNQTLGERTNFKNIKRLQPASHVILSENGVHAKQYWKLSYDVDDNLNPELFAEEVFQALQTSTVARSQLFDKGFISLSGGLDSRLIAATVPDSVNYSAFTAVDSMSSIDTLEVNTAREVAALLHLDHQIKQFSQTTVSDQADDIIRLIGGLLPVHHPATTMPAVKLMATTGGFKLSGGPGDSLAGSFAYDIYNLDQKRTQEQTRKFCVNWKLFSPHILAKVFHKDILAQYYHKLDESMFECFEQLSGPTATHRITAWAMVFRQPGFTFTSPIHNHPDVTEASPHLGYKYSELMLRLPASWIIHKNFYKFMIYHCIPQLREVVYANTGEKLHPHMNHYRISHRMRIKDKIKKVIPSFILAPLKKKTAPPVIKSCFEYNLLRGDKNLFGELKDILHSISETKHFFSLDDCDRFIDNFQHGRNITDNQTQDAQLMSSLATICYLFKNL